MKSAQEVIRDKIYGSCDRPFELAEAVIAALKAAGFMIVPREPTAAMCVAAATEIERYAYPAYEGVEFYPPYVADVWKAAIEASEKEQGVEAAPR